MNGTQITNTATPIIAFLAGLLASKVPWLDAGAWTQILGAVVGLGATLWGAWSTRNNSIINQAAVLPEVNRVMVDTQATAAAVPASNVVAGP